jgi:hypothetical protein
MSVRKALQDQTRAVFDRPVDGKRTEELLATPSAWSTGEIIFSLILLALTIAIIITSGVKSVSSCQPTNLIFYATFENAATADGLVNIFYVPMAWVFAAWLTNPTRSVIILMVSLVFLAANIFFLVWESLLLNGFDAACRADGVTIFLAVILYLEKAIWFILMMFLVRFKYLFANFNTQGYERVSRTEYNP